MGPLLNAAAFLINICMTFYIYVLILRVFMQKFRVSWYNPVSQGVIKLTQPIVSVSRRCFPGFRGVDLAIVLVVCVLEGIKVWVMHIVYGDVLVGIWGLLVLAVVYAISDALTLYSLMIVVVAVASWFTSGRPNPLVTVCDTIISPLMSRVRRRLPTMGGFDWSPVLVLIIIQLIRILLVIPAQQVGLMLLGH